MNQKHDDAYKSIGEVAKDLKLVNPKTGKLNTHIPKVFLLQLSNNQKNHLMSLRSQRQSLTMFFYLFQ